jgi:predicted DNA-binding transcriptional regulator AlpA
MTELVAVAEIAAMLGVSRQRVYQLLEEDPTFPKPIEQLAVGRIWRRADVEKWARGAGRL